MNIKEAVESVEDTLQCYWDCQGKTEPEEEAWQTLKSFVLAQQHLTHDTGEPQAEICPACNGNGEVTGPGGGGMELIKCNWCGGTGKLPVS